ncbi:MAG: hypothetical protein U0V73_02750 [Acidimicrobiia bacterium]
MPENTRDRPRRTPRPLAGKTTDRPWGPLPAANGEDLTAAVIVIGVPLGIVLGHWLWALFAGQIAAVPRPTVPVPSIAAVIVGALMLANLAAAWPGHQAARTSTASLLHSE